MTANIVSTNSRRKLIHFVQTLVDQTAARPIVMPDQPESGYWFGGGNMIQHADGSLLVCGRFRSGGDSRTGIKAGTRGRELTIFRSTDGGQSFERTIAWDKTQVAPPHTNVLSIEGAALGCVDGEYRLYVSSEKDRPYPEELKTYQKPGAGLWTIDVLRAGSLNALADATPQEVLAGSEPGHLHVKDPFLWHDSATDSPQLGYCSHPFSWTSSNSGRAFLDTGGNSLNSMHNSVISRGTSWDVAMTRATCVLPVPAVAEFADRPHAIIFYCGGECLRPLDEHDTAVQRPRGYSCEELGGAVVYVDGDVTSAVRLSELEPLFVSPYGTGCSRYVDVLATEEQFLTTWQQSQQDCSQPLVLHSIDRAAAESHLR